MRKQKFRTASYLRDGRGMSHRAIISYSEGAMPASKWAIKLGLTTEEVRTLLDFDSWHHTGKYAMRTDFYKLPEGDVIVLRAKDLISIRRKKFWSSISGSHL